MCGIGGILRTDGQPIPEQWLDAIDARIAYRGPDDRGRFRDRVEIDTPGGKNTVEIAFVHRRLSIIDHANGAQPMVSERGRNEREGLVAVVFNGCIYNHRQLRTELEAKGHRFLTHHSDTEVLIHGWRQWGKELPGHLEGMYAFAVWDRAARSLFLSRDAYGEKPLFLRSTGTPFPDREGVPSPIVMFASEPRSLQLLPASEHVSFDWCRMAWLVPYLLFGRPSQHLPGPDLVDIMSCGAGDSEFYVARDGKAARETVNVDPRQPTRSDASIETLLEQAVARRLEADVPLGCFLSGGVDSSLIAHFARKHKPDLRTFCVKMPDPRYDESDHAERVAAHLHTDHATLDCDPHPADDLLHLIHILGQPFGDSSILPTYWVSMAAREHVKVAIAGDGGDELFVGYQRYMAARVLARHWPWLRLLPSGFLKRSHPKSPLNKLGRLVDMARDYPRMGLAAMESIFSQTQIAQLLDLPSLSAREAVFPPSPPGRGVAGEGNPNHDLPDPHHALPPSPPSHSLPSSPAPAAFDPLAALRRFDIDHYLPEDLLTKVDTASMACALEVRCPFLDRDLAAAALNMPIDRLIPGGKRKALLRNIARNYLPGDIVDRPKMGFAIPVGQWFRSDHGGMKTLLLDHLNSADPFGPLALNRRAVQRFINEHISAKRDHGHRLFTLLTLSIWAKSLPT